MLQTQQSTREFVGAAPRARIGRNRLTSDWLGVRSTILVVQNHGEQHKRRRILPGAELNGFLQSLLRRGKIFHADIGHADLSVGLVVARKILDGALELCNRALVVGPRSEE